jgi:hypothetical protein
MFLRNVGYNLQGYIASHFRRTESTFLLRDNHNIAVNTHQSQNRFKILVGNLKERHHLGQICAEGRFILK